MLPDDRGHTVVVLLVPVFPLCVATVRYSMSFSHQHNMLNFDVIVMADVIREQIGGNLVRDLPENQFRSANICTI